MDILKSVDLSSLPRKKYMVMKYILDHPGEIILMNTLDLANKLKVDPVTIIKGCQEIGCNGFHDLKKRLKVSFQKAKSPTSVDKFLSEFEVNSSVEEAIRNALVRDSEMLTKTIEKISMQRVAEACNAIINSNQTYIIGLGYIGVVANYLNILIRSHVPQVHAITEYNGMLFDYMGHFTREDVVIAIGFDKCQNQTIKAFKKARERGATTIMITDSEYSPLCPYSKYGLFTHNAPNYFLSPLIGAFSLCNALLHGIVEITKPRSTKRSAAYNKLLNEEKVYYNS